MNLYFWDWNASLTIENRDRECECTLANFAPCGGGPHYDCEAMNGRAELMNYERYDNEPVKADKLYWVMPNVLWAYWHDN